jgi:hypothetical protein
MSDQGTKIKEKIRQTLEKLGQALEDWLDRQRPQPQPAPIPVPVDRPYHRRGRR